MKQKLLQSSRMNIIPMTLILCIWFSAIQQTNGQEVISTNRTGTQDGWYWSFWKDNGNASMTLYPGGRYTTTWNGVNNFTAGKGWRTGAKDKVICWDGTYNGGSNGFLAVYGWTKDPLIEYYIVEKHGQWTPPGSGVQQKGSTYSSDGSQYKIFETTRTQQPSIIGTATFQQYWSVRQSQRSAGTVTFANHVAAWEAAGMRMGTTWDYLIIESEGYQSTGNSDITIKTCGDACTATLPTGKLSYSYEVGDVATQLTATGTGLKWYASSTSTTPLGSAPTPSTATAGITKYYVTASTSTCETEKVEITVSVMQTYKIFKTGAAITIDGAIDEVWTNAKVLPMNASKLLSGTVSGGSDLSGYGKLLYDDTNLYMLAVVTDESKQNDSPNSYDDDLVELYIDADNAKATSYDANDCQFSFGWNDGTVVGTIPAEYSKTGITYSAVASTNGYIIEAKLPWSTLKASATANKIIGIDFMINDDDDGSARDAKMSYNAATDDAYQDASLFGAGKLINESVITATESFGIENISIYPNPSTSELNITGFTRDFEYSLFDNAGRVILEGQNAQKLNISTLDAGMYTLKVKQGDMVKIIKVSKL